MHVRHLIAPQLLTDRHCRCLASRDGGASLQELTEQQQDTQLQSYFLFSLVWSLGANTDAEGRAIFDSLLRKLISRNTPPELAPFVTAPEVDALFLQCRAQAAMQEDVTISCTLCILCITASSHLRQQHVTV